MNATVTIETINPKKAQHYLATLMEGQRHLREGHVIRLASMIESGDWHLTSDAILLVKGRLANGQHRLQAVLLSDKECDFLVLRTADEQVYKVLDAGLTRTYGDALTQIGVTLAKEVAAVTALVLRYDIGALTTFGHNSNRAHAITRTQIIDYVEEHQKALETEVDYCVRLAAQKRIVSPALAATLLHIANRKGKGDPRTFINSLYLGGSQDAAFDLRERLIRNRSNRFQLRREHTLALMIKAYRSFVNGTRPQVLKMMDGEKYPLLP